MITINGTGDGNRLLFSRKTQEAVVSKNSQKFFMKVLYNILQILSKKGLKSMLFGRDTQSSNYKHIFFGIRRIRNLIYNPIIFGSNFEYSGVRKMGKME